MTYKYPAAGAESVLSQVSNVTEIIHSPASSLIRASNGTWQILTLASNDTLTFDIGQGQSVFLTVNLGGFTLALTNIDEWVGGLAPVSLGIENAFLFWSDDGVTVTGVNIGVIS